MASESILIVEDEAISALEISKSLESWGYKVVSVADTGEKAVQKSLEEKPDLILMDITLKGEMDGIDAAATIKTFLDIPIIYLTALSDVQIFERVKETDATAYLVKPIEEVELRNNITLALHNQQNKKKEIFAEKKTGLEDVQLFMKAALPEMASNLSITERSLFLGRFMRLFEQNMKPLFQKYTQNQVEILYENLTDEEKLRIYLSWVANLYQNMGFQVKTRSHNDTGIMTVQKCAWSPMKPQDIFLCLICQSIMELTYSWTKLPGIVESEPTSGVLNSVCRFKYNLDEEY